MTRVLKVWIMLTAVLMSPYVCLGGEKATHTDGNSAAYSVKTVPNVHIMNSRHYVSDPANLLTSQTKDSINTIFAKLEKATGIETAVVMLPSIGDSDVFEFGHSLFRYWGIGKKGKDNGLLVIYVADIHKIRFITGYGLEGVLTDAICKRIQTRYMIPAFRQGDTDAGIMRGTAAIYRVLEDSMNPDQKSETGISPIISFIILASIILLSIVLFKYHYRRSHTCRHCGKSSLRTMSRDYYTDRRGHRIQKEILICDNCGKITVRNKDIGGPHDNSGPTAGNILNALFLSSLLSGGRGHGGGGFSGGSFGGGDSGGGGSGSDW